MTTDEMTDLRKLRYNSTVVHLDRIHPDLMVLRVKPDFPRPAYLAGQYCALGLGNWEARVEGWVVQRWWEERTRPSADGYYTYAPS